MQYSWFQWRTSVLAIIRFDFGEILRDVKEADIDWASWRTFYDEGQSPQSAVDVAFLRDLKRSGCA
jgi:hypothetical protein